MTRAAARCAMVLALLALTACGEREQTAKPSAKKADGKPWESDASAFNAPGFQGGDRARWEAQLTQRAQSQNDYAGTK